MIKIVNVVGARPNFMKIAPLIEEIRSRPGMAQLLVHTGQHYDDGLSRVFFEELGIPLPDLNLEVGSGDRQSQIATIMERFAPVLDEQSPDLVVVVGDVNSTIACARVARERGIAVAHVEAGLRSFDDSMPEEHNRRETDEIADYLFVTERAGLENLAREDVPGRAFLVGNVMIDTLVRNLDQARRSPVLDELGLASGAYFTGTFHRPSNVDRAEDLLRIVELLEWICDRAPMVLPLHPRTRNSLESHGLMSRVREIRRLTLASPLGYHAFLRLLSEARAVITDSGGIQEETTYLGVPCLTMRENTERPATIEIGSNVLVGSDRALLVRELDAVLADRFKTCAVPELWDGRAAQRIVAILERELGT